jgi:acyl-CoA thioester hydrolase
MANRFTASFTAAPEAIDELGHVNNAVWVQWIQQVATAHWQAVAPPDQQAAYVWVVVRHEIDYLRALGPGEHVTARTWVADAPQGAKFDRFMEFTGADGRVHVRARTVWALLDKASGRPLRVTAAVVAPFLG